MLKQRLDRWVAAGLIDGDQAERILAHEEERGRPRLLHAVVGLAGLAIAIGIVSIVASNWDAIPGRLKIVVDLLLVAGVGVIAQRFARTGPGWAREVSILVMYGLVLASLALIGQVYQLGGTARTTLAVWSGLTALLMAQARSGLVAFVWLAGLQTTCATWLVWSMERRDEFLSGLMLGGFYWVPLVCIGVGRLEVISRNRPALSRVLQAVGWSEVVLFASVAAFAFYEELDVDWRPGLWVGFAVAAGLSAWVWATLAGRKHQHVLLSTCLVLAFLPLLLSPGDLDVMGAVAFILVWLAVAYAAHGSADARVLNLATAVIGVRILVVYFEVFGSLLGTGIGLVVGGGLTLLLVWLWLRLRRRLAPEVGP